MKKLFLKLLLVTIVVVTFTVINFSRVKESRNHGTSIIIESIKAIGDNEGGGGSVDYRCRCKLLGGTTCASNNYGSLCAPTGTAKCWGYNGNCSY